MLFPGALPAAGASNPGDTLATAGHTSLHNTAADESRAIATKIGTGASTPTSGVVLRGNGAGTSAWSQVILTSDVSGVLPQANGGTGTTLATGTGKAVYDTSPTLSTPILTNATGSLNQPTIADFTNAQHNHANAAGGGQLGISAFPANTLTKVTTIFDEVAAGNLTINVGAGMTNITNWTNGSLTTSGGDIIIFLEFTYYRKTSGNLSNFRVVIDSTTNIPSSAGFAQYTNEYLSHKMISRTLYYSGLSSGSHTVNVQGQAITSGTTELDTNDYLRLTVLELKR